VAIIGQQCLVVGRGCSDGATVAQVLITAPVGRNTGGNIGRRRTHTVLNLPRNGRRCVRGNTAIGLGWLRSALQRGDLAQAFSLPRSRSASPTIGGVSSLKLEGKSPQDRPAAMRTQTAQTNSCVSPTICLPCAAISKTVLYGGGQYFHQFFVRAAP